MPTNCYSILPSYERDKVLFYKDKFGDIDTLTSLGAKNSKSDKYCYKYCGFSEECDRQMIAVETRAWSSSYSGKLGFKEMIIEIGGRTAGCQGNSIADGGNAITFRFSNGSLLLYYPFNKCTYNSSDNNLMKQPILNFTSAYGKYPVAYAEKLASNQYNIDSIYYAPSFGLVRIVTYDNVYELINP
ncbi:MAG: hypothetical protein EAZ07_06170 [Cytophagales bacterium]|nr:MAG: hypothetical protein EAZ07_06170 [Cytophagales bacterium]